MANKLAKCSTPVLALEESRYPYLDQNLIEFILSIPATQLLRPGERRSLMRRSLAGIVPQEILARKTKQFAARTPIVALEENLDQLQALFDSPLCSRLGYVNQPQLMETLRAVTSRKKIPIVHLMGTISLELWLRARVRRACIGRAARGAQQRTRLVALGHWLHLPSVGAIAPHRSR